MGTSWVFVSRLSRGEAVSMGVLMKGCETLGCEVG